jgi:hypothetical protein
MKNKEIILKIIIFLIFLTGMIISDNNIVPNALYNKWGNYLELAALLIMIFAQRSEIAKLKERIKELEK